MPSASCSTRSGPSPCRSTLISLVVGRMPSARNLSPSSALMKDDLPLLNSPTTTSKNSSSSPTSASSSKSISWMSGLTSFSRAKMSCSSCFSSATKSSRSWLSKLPMPEAFPDAATASASLASASRGFSDGAMAVLAARMEAMSAEAASCVLDTIAPAAAASPQHSSRGTGRLSPLEASQANNAFAVVAAAASSAPETAPITGMLPAFCCSTALLRSPAVGPASAPCRTTRLAPCSAVFAVSVGELTSAPTRLPAPDSIRRATPIGTPFDESSTPSASAASAMSVRSTTSSTARPRSRLRTRHAAS
mmetsp:Transcript_5337/g.13815  ORF Transcript_5337/g.13815 Transcript_5337/m.13815 type:complete len:306 (-) Transcript_5337:66-983(-)